MSIASFTTIAAMTNDADMKAASLAFSTALQALPNIVKVTGQTNKGVAGGANMDWSDKTATAVTTGAASANVTGTWSGGGLTQSDVGRRIKIPGAGTAGVLYDGFILTVTSSTACTVSPNTSTAIAGTGTSTIGVLAPLTGGNVGYEIYRFNDTHQTLSPVFIKFIYATGFAMGIQAALGLKMRVGRALDGSGGLVEAFTEEMTINQISNNGDNNLRTTYLSSEPGRLGIGMFLDSTNSNRAIGSVARLVDNTGARIDKGSNVFTYGIDGIKQQYLPKTGVAFPNLALTAPMVDSVPALTSNLFDGDTGVMLIHPYLGKADNPAMDVLTAKTADYGNLVSFAVPIFGSNRTFLMVHNAFSTIGGNPVSGVAFRYE